MKTLTFFTATLTVLCFSYSPVTGIEPSSQRNPYGYGEYLTITCRRIEGAGRFPLSYSEHEITAINGGKCEAAFRTHVEYTDGFDIPGNGEVVLSGYFTQKQIGSPLWPDDAPERGYMDFSQSSFHFVDFFIATGVRSPVEARERFEREIISNRKKVIGKTIQ